MPCCPFKQSTIELSSLYPENQRMRLRRGCLEDLQCRAGELKGVLPKQHVPKEKGMRLQLVVSDYCWPSVTSACSELVESA